MESGSAEAATLRCGGEVRCVALAGGGAVLAAGAGGALLLWRAAAAGEWRSAGARRGAHRYGVTALAWGARLLASGGVDGAVRLWAAAGGAARAVALLGAPGAAAVRALCWAGARVAAAHEDGALRVWAAAGALLATLRAHDAALTALAAPAAALLFTADADGVLKVFDFNDVCSGNDAVPLMWRDGTHDLGALCAAASPNLPLVATAGHDGKILIWRISSEYKRVRGGGVLAGHSGAVAALQWAGELLASAAHDRSARLWRLHPAAGAEEDIGENDPAGICVHVLHAHKRYLTAIAIDYRQRILVTGSSDKTVRVWTLGDTSADDELLPSCDPSIHFGLGDLEGIEPIADDELLEFDSMASSDSGHEEEDDEECGGMCARRVYSLAGHGAPVNCLCVRRDIVASACSDGSVHLWTWRRRRLRLKLKLAAHEYPAMCVSLPTPALLSAGLDGVLKLWDLESGCLVRVVSVGGSERVGEEAGCGVRGVAVTRRGGEEGAAAGGGAGAGVAAAEGGWRALLATDAGTVQLWKLADDAAEPDAVWGGFSAGCTCVAWGACGRVCAAGGAGGELRVWAPRRQPPDLAATTDAHDLGVQAIGWSTALSTESSRVLGSVGADSRFKLWLVDGDEDTPGGSITLATSVDAHGGAVAALCWQPAAAAADCDEDDDCDGAALVATGGEDRWARVWRVRRRGRELSARPAHAALLPAPVLALAFLPPDPRDPAPATDHDNDERRRLDAASLENNDNSWYLVAGTLSGGVSVWALHGAARHGADGDTARHWAPPAVRRWMLDYVTAVPGSPISIEEECQLLERVAEQQVTGAWLLDTPVDEVLEKLGYPSSTEEEAGRAMTRRRLADELQWLRRAPYPHTLEALAPHRLLCPLSHTLLRDPVRASDGFTYDRATLAEHILIEGGAAAGVSGRRLRAAACNRRLRDQLRAFLLHHAPALYAHLTTPPDQLLQ